jgi:hypothetical protein
MFSDLRLVDILMQILFRENFRQNSRKQKNINDPDLQIFCFYEQVFTVRKKCVKNA